MSRWFRSEHMEYISLIVNEDAAHDCLSDLGKLSSIQFTDLNPDLTPFQRRYVSYVRRCDELERKLRFFGNECDNFGLELHGAGDVENFLESNNGSVSVRGGSSASATGGGSKGASGTQLLESLEVELEGESLSFLFICRVVVYIYFNGHRWCWWLGLDGIIVHGLGFY